jgi:hypothetical protein
MRNPRYEWLAKPYSAGTPTRQETPSFAWRTNGVTKAVAADAFQVKSLSVKRFKESMGVLESHIVQEIAAAIALVVGYEI